MLLAIAVCVSRLLGFIFIVFFFCNTLPHHQYILFCRLSDSQVVAFLPHRRLVGALPLCLLDSLLFHQAVDRQVPLGGAFLRLHVSRLVRLLSADGRDRFRQLLDLHRQDLWRGQGRLIRHLKAKKPMQTHACVWVMAAVCVSFFACVAIAERNMCSVMTEAVCCLVVAVRNGGFLFYFVCISYRNFQSFFLILAPSTARIIFRIYLFFTQSNLF